MPRSKTTWSQDEIENLVREYLWRSGLRPVEKSGAEDDRSKRKPRTFQWGFKPRISLTTEVEPDPAFEDGEHVGRCHNCGQVVRLHAGEMKTVGVETGRLDARQSNRSAEPREMDEDPEPVDIPLDPKLMPPGSAKALKEAQEEEKKAKEIARKRGRMGGESGKRPY
jgi:hypothetical protein